MIPTPVTRAHGPCRLCRRALGETGGVRRGRGAHAGIIPRRQCGGRRGAVMRRAARDGSASHRAAVDGHTPEFGAISDCSKCCNTTHIVT